MLRKRDSERHFYQKVNGYAPEKVVSEFIFYPLNGYAPEKNTWFGHYVHFFTILWTNEHQKQAIMPPSGVDYASEFLNGYAPEYVDNSDIFSIFASITVLLFCLWNQLFIDY